MSAAAAPPTPRRWYPGTPSRRGWAAAAPARCGGRCRAAAAPPVAVKVLVAGDPERQAREAALLGALDHPHLVRLLEVVHQPRRGGAPRVALVLDLLAGGSLAALLARRGRLRPGEVVTAIAPVAAALAHAHAHGVVHGDLSPGNIVFTAEGRPVLTDLGVARVLGETSAGEVTPAYVDPTVARGGAPGPASDVFGVAAAAFHALTGDRPVERRHPRRHPARRRRRAAARPGRARPRGAAGAARGDRPGSRRRPARPRVGGRLRARPAARLPTRAGAAAAGRRPRRRTGPHRPRSRAPSSRTRCRGGAHGRARWSSGRRPVGGRRCDRSSPSAGWRPAGGCRRGGSSAGGGAVGWSRWGGRRAAGRPRAGAAPSTGRRDGRRRPLGPPRR